MRTFVYADGFNLYYGALRATPWKWIDLPALFARVLQPHDDILTVNYFTARVSGREIPFFFEVDSVSWGLDISCLAC